MSRMSMPHLLRLSMYKYYSSGLLGRVYTNTYLLLLPYP